MNANWNWLQNLNGHADEPGRPQAMPVFAGQKLVVVGGSSGWGARPPPTSWPPGAAPSSSARTPARSTTPSRHWPRTAGLRHHRRPDRPRTGGPGPPATGRRDATLLINAAVLSSPSPSWSTTAPPTAPTSNWTGLSSPSPDRRSRHGRKGRGGVIVHIGSMWAHQATRPRRRLATRRPRADCAPTPTTWPSSSPPPHPGQRGRSGRRRRPDLREVRPP